MKVEYHKQRVVEKILKSEMGIYGVQCRICAQDILTALEQRGMFDPAREDIAFIKLQKYGTDDVETYQTAMKIARSLEEFELSVNKVAESIIDGKDNNEEDDVTEMSDETNNSTDEIDTKDTPPHVEYKIASSYAIKRSRPKLSTMKACLYCRVDEKAIEEYETDKKFPAVIEKLSNWCEAQGWDITETILDPTEVLSSKQKVLESLIKENRTWNILVVEDKSSLALYGLEYLRMFVEDKGGKIVIVDALANDTRKETQIIVDDLINKWEKKTDLDGNEKKVLDMLREISNT